MDRLSMDYGYTHILKLRMLLNEYRHRQIGCRVHSIWVRYWISRRSQSGVCA